MPQNDGLSDERDDTPIPARVILVTGAPRTGTHFLHALLCTSERANPFVPEYHYFYFLLEAYLHSMRVRFAAEYANFESKEAFAAHHFRLMRMTLRQCWNHLGRPEVLVMKQCSFTPVIPVMARHFSNMSFVCTMRDARDSIASEVRATQKARNDPTLIPLDEIEHAINRFNLYYGSVVRTAPALRDRLFPLRYEDLARGIGLDRLAAFTGLMDIDPARLWKRARFDIGNISESKMHSNLWGQPLSDANIGRFTDTLPADITDRILEGTRRVALRYEALLPDDDLIIGLPE